MKNERWKDIEGYNGLYQISDCGRVKSFQWNKIIGNLLSPGKSSNGYYSVVLYLSRIKKTAHIPRLVALHFIPNPKNKPQVNHKDGVKTNDYYTNLEWMTCSENNLHSYRVLHKKALSGENHPEAKLNNKKVKKIREKYKYGKFNYGQLAKIYNVSPSVIWHVIKNRTWKGVITNGN